jgi:hypothetical protein
MQNGLPLRWVTSLSALLALTSWLACSSSSDDDDDCSSDTDCKGDRICEGGECINPAGEGGGTAGEGGGPGECIPGGGECSAAPCCAGSTCVDAGDAGMRCGADCTSNDQCQSGCCGTVGGPTVCAPAAYCAGSDPICAGECIDDPGCYTAPPFPQSNDCLACVQGAADTLAPCAFDAALSSACTSSTPCWDFVSCLNGGGTQTSCASEHPAGYAVIQDLVLRFCGCGF